MIAGATAALFGLLGNSLGSRSGLWGGVGLIIGGGVAWWVGQHMNVARPKAQIESALAEQAVTYQQLAEAGQFSRGPGYPLPTSLEDAHAQAQAQLMDDRAYLTKALPNRHTVFFIPMQYIALIFVAVGVVVSIGTMLTPGR